MYNIYWYIVNLWRGSRPVSSHITLSLSPGAGIPSLTVYNSGLHKNPLLFAWPPTSLGRFGLSETEWHLKTRLQTCWKLCTAFSLLSTGNKLHTLLTSTKLLITICQRGILSLVSMVQHRSAAVERVVSSKRIIQGWLSGFLTVDWARTQRPSYWGFGPLSI